MVENNGRNSYHTRPGFVSSRLLNEFASSQKLLLLGLELRPSRDLTFYVNNLGQSLVFGQADFPYRTLKWYFGFYEEFSC